MATPPESESNHSNTAYGPPFDDPDADIILRSSDRVDFMVYKLILSKASPFFKTMFSLPQPDTDTQADSCLPIVELAENSEVVADLLSAIYPHTLESDKDDELSLNGLIAALDMARKYDMTTASRRLLVDFKGLKAIKDSPLEVFCAAYSRGLGDVAQITARALLKRRLNLDDMGDTLEHTNGPALHKLWKFHRACSAAAVGAISGHSFPWIPPQPTNWWSAHTDCRCLKSYGYSLGAQRSNWSPSPAWVGYLDRARNALREHPCSEAITDPAVMRPSYQVDMCDLCRHLICGLPEFSRLLGEEVDRVVSKVRGLLHLS